MTVGLKIQKSADELQLLVVEKLSLVDEEHHILIDLILFKQKFLKSVLLCYEASLRVDLEVRTDVLEHPEDRRELGRRDEGRYNIFLGRVLAIQITQNCGFT